MNSERSRLRDFLSRHIRHHELADNEDIFASGYLNSLFAMQLVLFLEKEFNIKIENEDLKLDNFRSIDAMAGLVARKTSPATENDVGNYRSA